MKHFKKQDGSIWAFESDGSQDELITSDMIPINDADLHALRNLPKTPEQVEADIIVQTQARLDTWAKMRGYDGILSACTYATSTVPKFATEGQLAVTKRDETWAALYAFVEQVKAGTQSMPTGYADVEPLLPVLEWPL